MLNILRTSLRIGRVTTEFPNKPETGSGRGAPQMEPARCDGTGECASSCPAGAISISRPDSSSWRWQIDLARCVFCGWCQDVCPNGAITMTGRYPLASRTREGLIIEATRDSGTAEKDHAPIGPSAPGTSYSPTSQQTLRGNGDPLRSRIAKLLKRSLHIRHMAAGSDNSCDWEIAHLLSPVYDVQRLGIDFVASPRHADLLLVTGAVTRNLEAALYATYEAMPAPRLVVAVGSEACGGGVLQGSYAVAGGVDRCLPVDVYIPGDPPTPQALIHGLLIALDRAE